MSINGLSFTSARPTPQPCVSVHRCGVFEKGNSVLILTTTPSLQSTGVCWRNISVGWSGVGDDSSLLLPVAIISLHEILWGAVYIKCCAFDTFSNAVHKIISMCICLYALPKLVSNDRSLSNKLHRCKKKKIILFLCVKKNAI